MDRLSELIKERDDYQSHLALIEQHRLTHPHSGNRDRTAEIAESLRHRIAALDKEIAKLQRLSEDQL
jgi:hypothetical protein